MTTWLEARDECAHEPNARGTQCQHCGIPAEMVTPDELAEALTAECERVRLAAHGQTSWLDEPKPSRCWQYLHTVGVPPIRCTVTPDYHDGPCNFPR